MNKRHRRISPGTVIMLMIMCVVLVGCAMVLPGLMGDATVRIDVREVLSVLQLGDIPTLSLNDIPIKGTSSSSSSSPSSSSLPASSDPAAQPQETIAPIEASATAEPTAAPTVKTGGSFTLTIGGSVCMDDAVRKAGYYSDSKKYDFTEMLSLLTDEMTGDMTLLSLENLILPDSKVSSLNAPDAVSDMLRECGVQMVALGFDQVYDKGTDGVQSTLTSLQSRNLTVIGAYASQEAASQSCIKTLGGVPVAFLHYTESLSTAGTKAMKSGDSYAVKLANSDTITADITRAREQGAAVVVVSVNWGKSGASKPTSAQTTLAQEIADAGADVIVGTGTRVVQPIAWLTRKSDDGAIAQTLCAWSLGSLLNESRKDGNVAAILLHLQILWDGERISFGQVSYTPTYIWRQKKDGQYQYRVVASDCDAPGGMSDDQQGYMAKALRNIQSALADSPVVIREK